MHLDQVVLQVLKVQQEHKELVDRQVLKVLLVMQQQVLKVLLDQQVHRELKDIRVTLVVGVLQVHKVHKVIKDKLVQVV